MAELSVVGKNIPRVDALEKVTGKAEFVVNFQMPRMLYGKVVRSPHPHARIKGIDVSKAEKLAGVRAIVTAMDAPPIKLSNILADRYAFPPDLIVRSVGDAVAAVAADTEDIAEQAAGLVDVSYEPLPAVFDVEEAFRKDPPAIVHPGLPTYDVNRAMLQHRLEPDRPNVAHHFKIRHGDVEAGFKQADLVVENRYYVPRIHHCQLEPCVCVAWVTPDGTVVVRTSSQGVWMTKELIAKGFNLPLTKVRVECPYAGGGFGGKGRTLAEPYAILLSQKVAGRPVKITYTRDEHFQSGRCRIAVLSRIKDGVKKDGTLVAREVTILVDMGAYTDLALWIVRNCSFGAVGTYRMPNFKLDSYAVYTNTPMAGPFRGFGSAEVNWGVENQMDILAEKLGIDAVEFRRKNILREGDKDCCGQTTHDTGLEQCLDKVRQWIGWGQPPPSLGYPWKVGRGLAIGNKYSPTGLVDSALVKVHADGMVEVRHNSDEIGMGVNTVVAQIAAESFGIPVDCVKVVSGDTDTCPYGWPPVGSHTTFYLGNALLAACEDVKRQLVELAAPKLGVPLDQLEVKGRKVSARGQPDKHIEIRQLFRPAGIGVAGGRAEIIGQSSFEYPTIPEDPETGQSERVVVYFSYGAQAVDVAVDVETGKVKVLRSAGCFDAGQPINPQLCEAQIDGGISMGIGSALYEELMTDNGAVINPSFADYKMMNAQDMPDNRSVGVMLADTHHREGPFGAKGVGEGVMVPYAPAVANAVYNAVGVRITDLPLTSEKVLKALKEKQVKTGKA